MALVYTPLLSWRLLRPEQATQGWALGLAALCIGIGGLWLLRAMFARLAQFIAQAALSYKASTWFCVVLLIGAVLRLAWIYFFPTEPISDDLVYARLARQLAVEGSYVMGGSSAYWPPGYPLLIAGLMRVFGPDAPITIPLNLFLFALSLGATLGIARFLGQEAAGRIAILLLALWPGYLSSAGIPSKEMVLIALLPTIFFLYLQGSRGRPVNVWTAAAGLLLGGCALTQPSLMLFPFALLCCDLLIERSVAKTAIRVAFVIAMAALAVLPWSLRNYEVFGAVVPISTNGGDNFYRANNEWATGGYTERGKVDLAGLPEREADRRGKQLALEWIRSHPDDFLKLAVEKQIRFMGDDAGGIYVTMRRAVDSDEPSRAYAAAKAGANLFWMTIWLTIIAAGWRALRGGFSAETALLMLPLLYFFGLHSVFESSSKYHAPAWAFIALAAALVCCPRERR
ncbi:MAG TPA: hypothetical protein VJM53_08355 [Burkholderiales bacterium]|nr:hypothetical protein [Burkholderiales bacterium]